MQNESTFTKFDNLEILKDPVKPYMYSFKYPFDYELLEFCRKIKNSVGYKNFNFNNGCWRFNNIRYLKIITDRYPETKINPNMNIDIEAFIKEAKKTRIKEEKAKELKNAKTSDIEIKGIKGELYPYQKVGVEFFVNNNGKAILADVMGTGKSLQALAYVVHKKIKKTLVICPASAKFVWEDEVKKWTDLKSYIIDSKSELSLDIIDKHDIFIINYDIIKKFFSILSKVKCDCLICDEFHYIKNIKAQRTKFVKALAKRAQSLLLLSGTPFLNRPVELFNGLNLMDPYNWNDWYIYTKKYCDGKRTRWGWDARGASNIKELHERINRYFLRRTKDEVLKELPPKRFIIRSVNLEEPYTGQYQLAKNSFVEYLKDIKQKDVDKKSAQASKLVKLGELKQIASNGKVWAAKEIIQSILDAGEKVVLFSSYNGPLEELKKHFGTTAVVLTGKTKNEDRRGMVQEFQNNKNIKIFLGGIKSAGIGITLTAATNVIFLDFSWTPADHLQAVDRIHRIGQKADSITIYQLVSKGTIDEHVSKILYEKQKIFHQLIEKENASDSNIINSVLRELEKDF